MLGQLARGDLAAAKPVELLERGQVVQFEHVPTLCRRSRLGSAHGCPR
jgi:hypothetical protein